MPDLSTTEALLRLLLAAALGGAIGLEREMRDHEAGFRTHLLVSLGSCAFTLISSHGWSDWTFSNTSGVVFDPTRIAAQIVTGIGFLGAGAIIVRGINVRGPDDGGDALGRRRDRNGFRNRLLRGRDRRGGARPRLARPAQVRQRTLHLARPARGVGARDRPQARRGRGAGAGPDRGARRAGERRRVRRRPDDEHRPAPVAPVGVGARRRAAREARRVSSACSGAPEGALASGNAHKLDELRAALPGWEIELIRADAFPAEDGETYYENARGKALFGREVGEPRRLDPREDSGIEAAALAGRPGVASARWAEDGVAQLLAELDAATDRRARYVCELVALAPDGRELRATGILEGSIASERRGDEGVRLRPDLRAGGRGAHRRRARQRWKRATRIAPRRAASSPSRC
jgi:non-canonical purine NTP pyrophosphatase (RdgB/HAM1 family)